MIWLTAWTFKTANFRIALEVTPATASPASTPAKKEHFTARVAVYKHGRLICHNGIADDYESESLRAFCAQHRARDPMKRNCSIRRKAKGALSFVVNDFWSMVACAIDEARFVIGREQGAGDVSSTAVVNLAAYRDLRNEQLMAKLAIAN